VVLPSRLRSARTKPEELMLGSVELCLFAVWAGRLIPEAACMRQMPALVEAASKFGFATFKLHSQRLWYVGSCAVAAACVLGAPSNAVMQMA
jgi:hypothetical protein